MEHHHLVKEGNCSSHSDQEDMMDLRRGPWTVEEDFTLINYIAHHGEGRWNSLARCAGLKRTGKSCRLRWLNYLRPDVRRGNITLEEQLLILELHSRWGNRWSKIAQHLPGRTDNEIKNYWRTRVQKHAKQLKCDVNSKQFKDTMRYLWMPRLVERIQAAASASSSNNSSATATTTVPPPNSTIMSPNMNMDMTNNMQQQQQQQQLAHQQPNNFHHVNIPTSFTPENSSTTAASSDSFAAQVSPVSDLTTDCYNYPVNHHQNNINQEYYPANYHVSYGDTLTSPTGYFNQQLGLDFQMMDQSINQWMDGAGDLSDSLWNVEDVWFLQQ